MKTPCLHWASYTAAIRSVPERVRTVSEGHIFETSRSRGVCAYARGVAWAECGITQRLERIQSSSPTTMTWCDATWLHIWPTLRPRNTLGIPFDVSRPTARSNGLSNWTAAAQASTSPDDSNLGVGKTPPLRQLRTTRLSNSSSRSGCVPQQTIKTIHDEYEAPKRTTCPAYQSERLTRCSGGARTMECLRWERYLGSAIVLLVCILLVPLAPASLNV